MSEHAPHKSCTGKRPYNTERAALNVLARHTKRMRKTLKAYKCDFCKKWHLGHPVGFWSNQKKRRR